jgi:hypothetical protein
MSKNLIEKFDNIKKSDIMKKRIFGLLGILVAFIILLSSCGLTEIEQSQEDYNYNKTIPKVLNGIQGSKTAIKTNTLEYSLNY